MHVHNRYVKSSRIALSSTLIALCAALAACSGADAPAASSGASSAAPAPGQPASTGAPSKVTAAQVCDYLRGKLPELKAIGSKEGASANLTGNIFGWYQDRGAIPDGSLIDQQTKAECPAVRTEVLAVIGFESFATL